MISRSLVKRKLSGDGIRSLQENLYVAFTGLSAGTVKTPFRLDPADRLGEKPPAFVFLVEQRMIQDYIQEKLN